MEIEVIESFKEVVGRSRKEVAQYLISRFNLMDAAQAKMSDLGIMTPWQAFVQVRLQIYESILKDPLTLMQYRCPYNIDLLKWARQNDFKTALATMSHCTQAILVLQILDIKDDFDFIATRDDVENGKPNPQIYLLVTKELKVLPTETLVIEVSPAGVKAALDAGMGCIAVATDFARKNIHASNLIAEQWIVDNPAELKTTAQLFIKERNT